MNIWFLSPHESPSSHASRTFNFSRELEKRGHAVTIFSSSYSHRTHEEFLERNEKWRIEKIEGINVIWLRTHHYKGNGWDRGINMLSFASRAWQVGKKLPDRPDIVVGDSVPPLAGWTALRLAKLKKAVFVYQIRDVWPLALVDNGGISRKSPVYLSFRAIEKYLYRKSQCICSTLPFLHEHVSASGGDPKKITWIPNGVNLALYPDTFLEKDRANSLMVMYVGGFGAEHDVLTIMKAALLLQKKGNDRFQFIMVGDGVKRRECEKIANLNNLKNVQFIDPVPKSEIPQLQKKADVLIASVIDSKTYRFGLNLNKLYDYFASGRPVIFSGRAPNDYVAESGAGLSIPPEDPEAMVQALEAFQQMSPEERTQMGKRARRYAEKNFDVKKLAKRMESMLLQALKDKENINAVRDKKNT